MTQVGFVTTEDNSNTNKPTNIKHPKRLKNKIKRIHRHTAQQPLNQTVPHRKKNK